MLLKNTAQKIHIAAYDSTTGAAKTGDAANITGYVSLDGTPNAIDDTNPAEVDATNMPGVYVFDLTAAETNCDSFALYAKSSTANIRLDPIIGFTTAGTAAAIAATVPDTQKVDVETIKTKSVTVDAGGTTFPASIHASGAAVAKSPATLATADVSGNLPADVKAFTVQPTVTGATLHTDYDAAKTAATQTSVDTIDGIVDAIVADTNELQTDWANGGRLDLILDARASQTSVDDVPTVAEFEARTLVAASYGTAANQSTIAGYLDTEVAAILAAVDTEVAAIKTKTDYLPSATAGAAGGLFIAGSNAATTVASWTCTAASTHGSTVLGNTTCGTWTQTGAASWGATTVASLTVTGEMSVGNGLVITCTTLNKAALGLYGNGDGAGMNAWGGTGNAPGIYAIGGEGEFACGILCLGPKALRLNGPLEVTGTTTLTGAVAATNASNDIRGVTWNAAWDAEVQSECDDALKALLAAGQWVKLAAIIDGTPSGSVVDDAGNSASTFKTDLTSATDDFVLNAWCVFTSGALIGQAQKVSDYNGTTKVLTVASAYTAAPAAADKFVLIGRG